MSVPRKVSKRPIRKGKAWKEERNRAFKALREDQRRQGLEPPRKPSLSNAVCSWQSEEEEKAERQAMVEEHLKVFREMLPHLLSRLSHIPDPRRPRSCRHKLTVLLVYGLLMAVFQMASRREANREMSKPVFRANLEAMFPELESLPHADTLFRLLERIDPQHLEEAHLALIRKLMRNKKFRKYLLEKNRYAVAIDGTQKGWSKFPYSEEMLERTLPEGEKHYTVYVLEANLVLEGGVSLPLMSEFLSYPDGSPDSEKAKQDCELKAFKRLCRRLKAAFPRLRLVLLLDGLYPNGPVFEVCRANHWGFMIVLQDESLPQVWEEGRGLHKLHPEAERDHTWGNRRQHYWWSNDIEYAYGRNERKRQRVHLLVCEEAWEDLDEHNECVIKTSRHAWVASEPFSTKGVVRRSNNLARHRWAIESGILVEKRQGYYYEHVFSRNWQGMKNFHLLMRMAHLLNTLGTRLEALYAKVQAIGVRPFLTLIRTTCGGPWLDRERLRHLAVRPCQIRLY